MDIIKTEIADLLILVPRRFEDERGFFSEVWNKQTLLGQGIDIDFVQDNHSYSEAVGTVRGLHFQSPPHAQTKLIRCGSGSVFDVAVDIRIGSPSYGKWYGVELTPENGRQMLVPAGFLHGFVTRKPGSELLYKCSDYYAPECDGAVRFDDPDLGIDWGLGTDPAHVSAKDGAAQSFAEFKSPFHYEGSS
ncbi:MAG: dTDP-4-dehydrorhamnose 3,5-epimerase [Pseudomonadota bacterium]